MADTHDEGYQELRRRRPRYPGTHPREFDQKYKELQPEKYPEMQQHVRARGMTPAGTHVPILLDEVMTTLAPQPGQVVADGTLGYGGHAMEFLGRVGPTGRLVGLDVDARQLERTAARLARQGAAVTLNGRPWSSRESESEDDPADGPLAGAPAHLHRSNFSGIAKVLAAEGLEGFDLIFADLGMSSMQIDNPDRGFSYKHDGPLDMRMDDRLKTTAADLVNTMTEEELAAAFLDLADEPDAKRIARRIVQTRERRRITRTLHLADIVFHAKGTNRKAWKAEQRRELDEEEIADQMMEGRKKSDLNPAARVFQALRIMVNNEMENLEQFLRMAGYCLKPGGRIGVLTFHSGEDRLVKHAFIKGKETGVYAEIADAPIRPGREEKRDNPRSASARFRWAVRA